VTWLARGVFVLLIGATFAAFFAAQRLKGEPPVVEVRGLARYFSPNADGRRDVNRFGVRLREATAVSIDVVDAAGDAVRRLTEAAAVEPGRALQLTWDGRTDAGVRAPDGAYRLRVTLSGEGRSVTPPRTTNVDTRPPRPRVRRIEPGPIVGPEPGKLEIRVGSVAARFPKRLRIYRTDGGPPREVATVRVPAGSRRAEWDGLVDGAPAPPGTYLVQVRGRDRAGNRGVTPAEVPPQRGESIGAPGITVRAIAAEAPLKPVTAGEKLTVNVDSRQRRYRWRLRRVGRSIPVATGRERPREPVELTAPDADSGLYLLELWSGEHTTAVPVLVQSRERARMVVVVPALTWVGTDEVDQDADGVPNTLEAGTAVNWPRVFAGGLPEDLTDRVAPLLLYLDRAGIRYDLTSDLDLALSRGPRASDRPGVLLAGSQRWVTRAYARRLRRYVLDGGRLASFGADSLRRGVTILRNRDETSGRLIRPTQPSPQDPFGTRLEDVRRTPEPVTLTPIGGDAGYGLLEGFDGALGGFSLLEESEPPREAERLLAALGVETAPQEEQPGVPEALPPPALPALAATQLGKGLVIRVGLPEWSARLGDRQVGQITLNIADLVRGAQPRIRSAP
jgi:flagellar hook assembly protein FlgD